MGNPDMILLKLLNNIFKGDEIKFNELSTEGANYSSKVYKITIKKENSILNLFAKVATWPAAVREQLHFGPAFENERYFYTDIVPVYEMLQTKYAVKDEDKFIISKYYGSNPNHMQETIVLEDLIEAGYSLYDRFAPMDWEYALKTVEELAKFHALSFVYEHEYPDIHEKNLALLDYKRSFFRNLKDHYYASAQKVSKLVPEHLRKKFMTFIDEQLSEEMYEKYYGSKKWKVLLHGDFRSSNIMYKKSTAYTSASVVPVDYQNVHHSSPSTDLYYLIYTATDANFRKEHLKNLLNHYYDTLSKWLTQMKLEPESTFSKNDFEEDYKDMSAYGLCVATFLLPIVLVNANEAPSVDEGAELADVSFKLSEAFKSRFLPILEEYVESGIFDKYN